MNIRKSLRSKLSISCTKASQSELYNSVPIVEDDDTIGNATQGQPVLEPFNFGRWRALTDQTGKEGHLTRTDFDIGKAFFGDAWWC